VAGANGGKRMVDVVKLIKSWWKKIIIILVLVNISAHQVKDSVKAFKKRIEVDFLFELL
jgi:hypothetical protein